MISKEAPIIYHPSAQPPTARSPFSSVVDAGSATELCSLPLVRVNEGRTAGPRIVPPRGLGNHTHIIPPEGLMEGRGVAVELSATEACHWK